MGLLAVGTVVLINFPCTDLQGYKKQPAVVVARSSLDTVVLCQITSRQLPDVPGITIVKKDFKSGGLPITSYVRPDKLFTVDKVMAEQNQLGLLSEQKIYNIKGVIRELPA